MAGVKFVEYKEKKILVIDLALSDLEEIVKVIRETKSLISKEPPASVLTLTDIKGVRFHGLVSKVAKEFTEFNKPFVKAGAIIGLDPGRVKEFAEIMQFSKRDFTFFPAAGEAKEWLIAQ